MLLLEADKPGEEIKLYINSPGGVVTSGFVLYDTIKMISSPVSTICMGLAASMGSILLSGGTKGKRFIFPNGEVMIHQPSGGGRGTSADLEIMAEQIRKTKLMGAELLAKNCGQTVEKVMKDFDNLVLIEIDQIDKFVEYIENYNETNNHSKNKQLINKCYSSKVVASHFEKIYKELDIAN